MQISSTIIPNENPVNLLNFTDFSSIHKFSTNKSYIPISTCVLEHILTNTEIYDLERLYYIRADALSHIRLNKGHQRSVSLSARNWAKKLNCSKAKILVMQQSLEQKGYFEISRSKNKLGKNMRNVITPTLPDSVFNALANTPNKFNIDTSSPSNLTSATYIPHLEGKREYLDRTKMFIKLNYQLLSMIISYEYLSNYSKVMWLDFYAIGYRYYLKHRDCSKNITDLNNMDDIDNVDVNDDTNLHDSYSLTITYKELQDKYSCSKFVISKTLKELETLGFISRNRIFVKNDDEDDNLHDKSIWHITVIVPNIMQQQLMQLKDRSPSASGRVVALYDPYVANSSQYINKYLISNTKDLDSIDSKKKCFEKVNYSLPETLSELSISYKNSFELEKDVNLSPIVPTTVVQETRLEALESLGTIAISAIAKVEEEQAELLEELNHYIDVHENTAQKDRVEEDSAKKMQLHPANNIVAIKVETPTASTTSIPNRSSSQDKPPAQAKSLQAFYPLAKEQVDKINKLSSREFSSNFSNQLLMKLYVRDPNKTFVSQNHMISYMSKAFRYELHQAPMVNHESFRFTANVSDKESVEMRQREKYLAEVEYNVDTSYESQLRRKIAGMFESQLAYQLLTEVKFDYQEEVEQVNDQDLTVDHAEDVHLENAESQEDNQQGANSINLNELNNSLHSVIEAACAIKLPEDLTLTDRQEEILEKAVMSVYGNIDINYEKIATNRWGTSKKSQVNSEIFLEDLDPNSIWYKIRKELRYELGEAIDKAWFSKITAEENLETKTLTLTAPTNFIRDYVKNNYGHKIQQSSRGFGYSAIEILTEMQVKYVA